jgi:hypothetical protein
MKQMTIVAAGLLVLNVAAHTQETKSHKHTMDSTSVQYQKEIATDVYVCPMHKDVRSDKPGKCPKCKMDLVKKEITKSAARKVTYTCPMHPTVKSDKPGKCPTCNMTLVPESKSK